MSTMQEQQHETSLMMMADADCNAHSVTSSSLAHSQSTPTSNMIAALIVPISSNVNGAEPLPVSAGRALLHQQHEQAFLAWWAEEHRSQTVFMVLAEFICVSIVRSLRIAELLAHCDPGAGPLPLEFAPDPTIESYSCNATMLSKAAHLCANNSLYCFNPWVTWVRHYDYSMAIFQVSP